MSFLRRPFPSPKVFRGRTGGTTWDMGGHVQKLHAESGTRGKFRTAGGMATVQAELSQQRMPLAEAGSNSLRQV